MSDIPSYRLLENRVLGILTNHEFTDHELTRAYFLEYPEATDHPDTPRKRRSDLTNQGLVIVAGYTHYHGRKVKIWKTK